MSIQAILDNCRRTVEGCDIAAFGDYKARLILRSSQSGHVRREALDSLCSDAASIFDRLDMIARACKTQSPHKTCAMVTRSHTRAFVRTDPATAEFFCVSGTSPCQAVELLAFAEKTLRDIQASA